MGETWPAVPPPVKTIRFTKRPPCLDSPLLYQAKSGGSREKCLRENRVKNVLSWCSVAVKLGEICHKRTNFRKITN